MSPTCRFCGFSSGTRWQRSFPARGLQIARERSLANLPCGVSVLVKTSKLLTTTGQIPTLIALCALIGIGAIAYSNSFDVPFLFDDLHNIRDNSHVRITQLDGQQLQDVATRSPSRRRPLANISFALNYYVGGYDVWGYHFVNLCIHLACGVLVYMLGLVNFRQLLMFQQSRLQTQAADLPVSWAALTAALIFVSHPIQTQSVTYIVQRMTSLATMFYLAALLLYLYGRLSPANWQRWTFWAASLVMWFTSMGCKEIGAVLPLTILLYEWYFFQDLDLGWLKRCSVYVGSIAASLVIVALYYQAAIANWLERLYSIRDFTLTERLLTQPRVILHYLSLVLWPLPSRFSLTHDIAISHSLFDPLTTLVSILVLCGLLAIAVFTARRYSMLSFAIMWCFLHLVMESSVIPLELVYEHRMYLPMVGISLLGAWAVFEILPQTRWSKSAIVVLVVALTMATHVRNEVWRDPETFWKDVVAKYPNDTRAYGSVASILIGQGDLDAGIDYYKRALELKPDDAKVLNNLGQALVQQGKLADAIEYFQRAVQSDPDYYRAQNNLGYIRASQGDFAEAERHYRRALQTKPDYAETLYNLGALLNSRGKRAEARKQFELALKFKHHYAEAHYNLGVLLTEEGNVGEANQHYQQAIEDNPNYAPAYNNLGNALARAKRFDEAIEKYRRALAIDPKLSRTHTSLATLLAMQGQLVEAVQHYKEALAIRPDLLDAHLNLAICLESQGNREEALTHCRAALNLAIAQGDNPMAEAARKHLQSLEQ